MRIIRIGLFLCFASMTWAQSPQQERRLPAKDKQSAPQDHRGTENSPLVVKTLTSPKSKEDADREAKESEEKRALERATLDVSRATLEINKSQLTANFWQTIFNGFLLVATAVMGFITFKAARAAEKSSDAAQATVRTMQDTAARQLRAYVFVESAEIVGVGVGETPKATITMKNAGQTPAYDLRVSLGVAGVNNVAELEELARKNYGATRVVGPMQLGPGDPISPACFYGAMLTVGMFDSLESGKIKLYFHGRADYTDAFGKPHWVTFRATQGEKGTPVGSNRLAICEQGNDADRD